MKKKDKKISKSKKVFKEIWIFLLFILGDIVYTTLIFVVKPYLCSLGHDKNAVWQTSISHCYESISVRGTTSAYLQIMSLIMLFLILMKKVKKKILIDILILFILFFAVDFTLLHYIEKSEMSYEDENPFLSEDFES